MRRSLVPLGFPDSVAPEYMRYQLWDTLQVASMPVQYAWLSCQSSIHALPAAGDSTGASESQLILSKNITTSMLANGNRNGCCLAEYMCYQLWDTGSLSGYHASLVCLAIMPV